MKRTHLNKTNLWKQNVSVRAVSQTLGTKWSLQMRLRVISQIHFLVSLVHLAQFQSRLNYDTVMHCHALNHNDVYFIFGKPCLTWMFVTAEEFNTTEHRMKTTDIFPPTCKTLCRVCICIKTLCIIVFKCNLAYANYHYSFRVSNVRLMFYLE